MDGYDFLCVNCVYEFLIIQKGEQVMLIDIDLASEKYKYKDFC